MEPNTIDLITLGVAGVGITIWGMRWRFRWWWKKTTQAHCDPLDDNSHRWKTLAYPEPDRHKIMEGLGWAVERVINEVSVQHCLFCNTPKLLDEPSFMMISDGYFSTPVDYPAYEVGHMVRSLELETIGEVIQGPWWFVEESA